MLLTDIDISFLGPGNIHVDDARANCEIEIRLQRATRIHLIPHIN